MFIESPLSISAVSFSFRATEALGGEKFELNETISRVPLGAAAAGERVCSMEKLTEYLEELRLGGGRGFFVVRNRASLSDYGGDGTNCDCCRCADQIIGDINTFFSDSVQADAVIYNPICRLLWPPFTLPIIPEDIEKATWDISVIEAGERPNLETGNPGSCGDQYVRVNGGPYTWGTATASWVHPYGMRYRIDIALGAEPAMGVLPNFGVISLSFIQLPINGKYRIPIRDTRPLGEVTEITTVVPHGLFTGSTQEVAGAGDSTIDGSHVITVTGPTTVTIPITSSGPGGTNGTVTQDTPPLLELTITDAGDGAHTGLRIGFTGDDVRLRPIDPIILDENDAYQIAQEEDQPFFQGSAAVFGPNGSGDIIQKGSGIVTAGANVSCGMRGDAVGDFTDEDAESTFLDGKIIYTIT